MNTIPEVPMFMSPLPGFSAGSGPNQGPVGCVAALLTYAAAMLILGGLLYFIYWSFGYAAM